MVGITLELDRAAHAVLKDRPGRIALLDERGGDLARHPGLLVADRVDARHDVLGRLRFVHPPSPPSAADAASSCRNRRRSTPSNFSAGGNSPEAAAR